MRVISKKMKVSLNIINAQFVNDKLLITCTDAWNRVNNYSIDEFEPDLQDKIYKQYNITRYNKDIPISIKLINLIRNQRNFN